MKNSKMYGVHGTTFGTPIEVVPCSCCVLMSCSYELNSKKKKKKNEESDFGICFYPSRLDWLYPEEVFFLYIGERHHPVLILQNLDVMGKN